MSKFRFTIDRPELVNLALVTAADAARERSGVEFDVGPWDDAELADGVIEIVGSDPAAELVAARLIAAGIGFEVEGDPNA